MQLPIGHFGRMRFAFKTDSNSTSQESTQMHCHESNKILHSLPIDDHGMHFQIFQSASSASNWSSDKLLFDFSDSKKHFLLLPDSRKADFVHRGPRSLIDFDWMGHFGSQWSLELCLHFWQHGRGWLQEGFDSAFPHYSHRQCGHDHGFDFQTNRGNDQGKGIIGGWRGRERKAWLKKIKWFLPSLP